MEEKKKVKVSLSAIVIFILIAIIIGMGCYIYKLNKDKYYMTIGALQQIEELNDKIDKLEEKVQKHENKENVELEENNNSETEKEVETNLEDKYNDIKFDNDYFLDNGQIIKIDEETNQFSSKELGLSFQYPNHFEIEYTIFDSIRIKSSENKLFSMSIGTIKDDYNEWLSFYKNDPWAVSIIGEGDFENLSYKGYYFETVVGNGLDRYKDKDIFIRTNDKEGYIAGLTVDYEIEYEGVLDDLEKVDWDEIFEKQDKMYDEYEPIFDNIVSTLKFKK